MSPAETSLVHFTKTLAVQLGRFGITVNCIHPGTTRTERTPRLLAARAAELGVTPEEAEKRTYAPDSPRGNTICRMVDAAEIAYVAAFLASQPSAASWSWRPVAPDGRCITSGRVLADNNRPFRRTGLGIVIAVRY